MSREPSPTPIPQNGEAPTPSDTVSGPPLSRSSRPSRACTLRAAARLQAAAAAAAASEPRRARPSSSKRRRNRPTENGDRGFGDDEDEGEENDEEDEDAGDFAGGEDSLKQCGKIVTSLVAPPPESQLPRWSLRSMWELASVLNFMHVFRPLLNITAEFSAEEFETALITPNDNLSDIHIPLLKAIPPVTRMALTRDTWVTVLCRKLRDWWHWVADGDLPIVASHGAEIEAYRLLDPGVRVVILKALCDIRVEQEDIRNYIDNSLKHGVRLSEFRKERVGGDSHGISYWYEDDPYVGHRLYREIRKFEVKRAKTKGSNVPLTATYQWETVATNFDEFEDVSEKLFTSKNRTEASLGKKLKNDMLPEIEKVHKRKEKLLKKQHRQALLLDNFYPIDGIAPGRSLRDRKPVTYTFDDYDRSINEAIKITKKRPSSPESLYRREGLGKPEASSNGKWSSPYAENNFSALSPKSPDYEEADDDDDDDDDDDSLDRSSNRRRQRPQRYSEKDFVAVSDNDADFDSDDDIVGEAIYDEEYLRKRKQRRKMSSSSEGDEEYHWDDANAEEEEEEEEEESMSMSDDSDDSQKVKKLPGRTRRETKLRSVGNLQSGLRRSKRSTRNRINYQQYEISDSEGESRKPKKSHASEEHSDESENENEDENDNENENENENGEFSMGSPVSDGNDDTQEIPVGQTVEDYPEPVEKELTLPPEKSNSPGQDETDGVRQRRFLDLNEIATGDLNDIAPGDLNESAPGCSFDDVPNTVIKDDDTDDF